MAKTAVVEAPTDIDGRTKAARRYSSLIRDMTAAFDPAAVTSLAIQLRIRQAALLTVRLEEAQTTAAAGGYFDPVELAQLASLTVAAILAAMPTKPAKE